MNKVEVNNGRIGFAGLLALIFITLKLTGYIDWSWWWVLAPLWIPVVVIFSIIAIIFFLAKR
jgi:hypothetical protein